MLLSDILILQFFTGYEPLISGAVSLILSSIFFVIALLLLFLMVFIAAATLIRKNKIKKKQDGVTMPAQELQNNTIDPNEALLTETTL